MASTAFATERKTPVVTRPAAVASSRRTGDLGNVLVGLIAGESLTSLLARLIVLRDRLEDCPLWAPWSGRPAADRRCARLMALCQLAAARVERLGRLRTMDAPPIVQRNEERMLVAALRALLETAGSPATPPAALPPGSGSLTSIAKEIQR